MKKQKIVITGAIGYLGTELCKIYSGETRYKEIIAIDNRFLSARVKQLADWGIQFLHGDIRDKEFMEKALQGADIVYHLASITDVAYTKKHETEEKELLINSVGIDGLNNVLQYIPKGCKILFPSSHTIYDGLQETMFDIPEEFAPQPGLMYSGMKTRSEEIIRENTNNHVIVRLASVYGLSEDNMRINIMPNLFSKIASQDGTISMFGGGVQYKSLVNIIDVVRAMKYLAEGEYIGTYHLSNENMTVADVANICKKVNPKITLVSTDDEIPNKGYTLSNQKLLNTGFRFLYNIEDSIREMITKWSYRDTSTPLEYIDKGGNEYIDSRGIIRNYELTEPINLIGYIESTRGTVRANHYHPIQEQKCLLISGRYISVTQDLSITNAPIEYKTIRPGDIAIIRPNVAHTMVFLQDSVFLNLVRGERDHDNYGITHTIPYKLVDDIHRDQILERYAVEYRTTCRCCGSHRLQRVLSLGDSPLANNLLDSADQECITYPLEWMYCHDCCNVQLSVVVSAPKMFDNYLYVSSTSQVFREHFEKAAEQYIQQFNLTSESVVWDIGSNDGVFLKPLQDRGIKVCGIEPAVNVAQIATDNGILTIQGYFSQETAQQAYQSVGSPDIITASNVFAHADDLADITRTAFNNLKPSGVFIIEVQYLMDTIKDMTFDNIYHEHVNYWSVTALNTFFSNLGYYLYHVEHINTHGGSIRCYICREINAVSLHMDSVQEYMDKESAQGIHSVDTFIQFGKRVSDIRNTVRKNMKLLKKKFSTICGYGSPAKATTALNYFGITGDDITYTVEDNTMKNAKWVPGAGIQIWELDDIYKVPEHFPELCIVFAWNFFDSIKAKLPSGIECISIKDLEITDGMPILDTYVSELVGQLHTGKVYDCFLFFNELNLLEMRMNILESVVDYFVIVEANITHSGVPREFCFAANRNKFTKWEHKIIYIQVTNMPEDFTQLHSPIGDTYDNRCYNDICIALNMANNVQLNEPLRCREYWQRESVIRALEHCTPDDIIMLSDVDEIPNPDTLQTILNNFNSDQVYSLRQNSYYYKLNLLKEKHWVGPRLASYSRFSQQPVGTFRHIRDLIISNGGWHFSFQTASGVANKLQAYSHSDMATEEVMNNLDSRIANYIDPFDRGQLKRVEIDSTYPQYLLDNIDNYQHMIA